MLKSKKNILILLIICIIIAGCIFIISWWKEKKNDGKEKEVLNLEYNFLQEEYDEKYNVVTDKLSIEENAVYGFEWSVTLSSGTCKIYIRNENGENIWNETVDSTSLFEKNISLSNLEEGQYTISIEINEETEGNVRLVVEKGGV